MRLALASLVVLGPVPGIETTATVTNTIWTFAAVAPWALVSLSERRRDVAMRAAVAFLATASTILSAVFLPLALGVALARRTRAAWLVGVAFVAGLLVEGAVVLASHGQTVGRMWLNSLPVLAQLIAVRVCALFLLGFKRTNALWTAHPRLLVIGAAVLLCVIFAVLLPRAGRRAHLLGGVFLAYALITFVVPVWGRGTGYVAMFGITSPGAGHFRYSVVPTLMLSSAVAVLAAPFGPGRGRGVALVARPLFIAHVALLIALDFRGAFPRSWTPDWPAAVEKRYATDCVGASPDTPVRITTDFFGAYAITLPCSRLAP